MGEATADVISVHCVCGKKLKAPASAVGRKARCPKCGNVVTLEAPRPRDDAEEAAFDMMGLEQPAASGSAGTSTGPLVTACPNCSQPMKAGAILCTACGYDTRTGQTLAAASAAAAAPAPAARPAATGTRYVPATVRTKVETAPAAGGGSFLKGCLFSGILAFIGALVWFGIAKATGYEIGWIAWGIGLIAGIGMMAGAQEPGVDSGMVAAGIAVGGIVLGKFMVFWFVVLPMFTGLLDSSLAKIGDDKLLHLEIVNETLTRQGIDPETASEPQRESASKAADAAIVKMDAKTKAAKASEGAAKVKSLAHEFVGEIDKTELFRRTMFGPKDIIFIVLALASAFKVATFGGGD